MLKIGITPGIDPPNPSRVVLAPKYLSYVAKDMNNYLRRPGVLPLMIPDFSAKDLEEFVGAMDGIVLQGGTDVAPEAYGEKPIGRWRGDAYRDRLELQVIDIAMKLNKPIYGICRGIQIMNVYFGGNLYQDIATQLPKALEHRNGEIYDQLTHSILLSEGEFLADINKGKTRAIVNSVHHQAIKDLGKDLKVIARSEEDGIVEAFYWTGTKAGRVMAVQWHPEFNASYKGEEILFDHEALYSFFLEHCKS